MIDPQIRMHDLDEGGWALLTRFAKNRQKAHPDELHVLHEAGTALAAVHTNKGPLSTLPTLTDDLAADARRLQEDAGVERVVLVDVTHLDDVKQAEAQHGHKDNTQAGLLDALQAAFWQSPGVVSHPEAPAVGQWQEIFDHFADRDLVITLTTESIRLRGTIQDGRLIEVTTLRDGDGIGGANVMHEHLLALRFTDAELEQLLLDPELPRTLRTQYLEPAP